MSPTTTSATAEDLTNTVPTTTEEAKARPTGKNGRFTDIGERENRMELVERFNNKSGVIRYLWAQGYERASIAKFLEVKYQHVRNVLEQKPKKPTTANS
jgi:hypothetical protein